MLKIDGLSINEFVRVNQQALTLLLLPPLGVVTATGILYFTLLAGSDKGILGLYTGMIGVTLWIIARLVIYFFRRAFAIAQREPSPVFKFPRGSVIALLCQLIAGVGFAAMEDAERVADLAMIVMFAGTGVVLWTYEYLREEKVPKMRATMWSLPQFFLYAALMFTGNPVLIFIPMGLLSTALVVVISAKNAKLA